MIFIWQLIAFTTITFRFHSVAFIRIRIKIRKVDNVIYVTVRVWLTVCWHTTVDQDLTILLKLRLCPVINFLLQLCQISRSLKIAVYKIVLKVFGIFGWQFLDWFKRESKIKQYMTKNKQPVIVGGFTSFQTKRTTREKRDT